MRLINVDTLQLEEFFGQTPAYAILSHTWGEDEVLFQDFQHLDLARTKAGFAKIKGCCVLASKQGLKYSWVDTCCIDKSSSAELSEAINSMFKWYKNSEICYVYLSDIMLESAKCQHESHWNLLACRTDRERHHLSGCASAALSAHEAEAFRRSRWFSRGWTLQELIAPMNQIFLDCDWKVIGGKYALLDGIIQATNIDQRLFQGYTLQYFSVAQRFSWAAGRSTTRTEDEAYSLMGIFEINMPLLYGEGSKSFLRLQEEIIKRTSDHSIFAWLPVVERDVHKLLAPSAIRFRYAGNIVRRPGFSLEQNFELGNNGLQIALPLVDSNESSLDFVLDCTYEDQYQTWESITISAVPTHLLSRETSHRYVLLRARPGAQKHTLTQYRPEEAKLTDVLILRWYDDLRRKPPKSAKVDMYPSPSQVKET